VGNGQYYDPSTGRFLTRGVQQDQSNPYTPWNSDPAGMLIAPLALLALVFGRKKNKTKFDQFVILFVIVVSVGLSVSACSYTTVSISTATATLTDRDKELRTAAPTIEYIIELTNEAGTVTKVIVEVSETPIPDNTSTATLESTCTETPTPSIDNAKMLLNAILKQESDLPKGFSVALFLAMAKRESGGTIPEYQNYNEGDPNYVGGALQLRGKYLNEKDYTPDQAGYDANVRDAIIAINEKYAEAIHEAEYDWMDYGHIKSLYFENTPDKVYAAMTVLFYNGGTAWSDSYDKYPMNIPYVGKVACHLKYYVPEKFGCSDPEVINILYSLQRVVNDYFKLPTIIEDNPNSCS
jgi:hypothetical protein